MLLCGLRIGIRSEWALSCIIGVWKEGDGFATLDVDPAIIIKCHIRKGIANPHQLLVVTHATRVKHSFVCDLSPYVSLLPS